MSSTGFQEHEKQSGYEDNLDPKRAECVVRGALALVLRASSCAGVAPLSFSVADAGWRIAVSPALAVFQRILMTILNVVGLAAVVMDFNEEPDRRIRVGESAVTAFVWVADLVVVLSIASLAGYDGASRMEQIIHLLKELQEINVNLNHDSNPTAEKIGIIAVPILVIYAIVVQSAEVFLKTQYYMDIGYNWSIMAMYSAYHACHILRLLALLQWGFVVVAVHGSAATINRRLERLCHVKLKTEETVVLEVYLNPPMPIVDNFTKKDYETDHPGPKFVAYPSQVQFMVHRLASSYGHLGELIRVMNETNGAMLIANLSAIFLHLVVIPYYMMVNQRSVEGLVRAAMHIAILLLTVEPCHRTHVEVEGENYRSVDNRMKSKYQLLGQAGSFIKNRVILKLLHNIRDTTKFLLGRLMVHLAPRDKKLARELTQFAKQTALTNFKFTPLGVLTLGRPLVASMFGGVATYLVILMQFYALTDD